ncbi:MAG TPA: bifunctional adenosylcobinamide kinase/adenosylcobinamide-phosphate guanylyltransferase [Gaiellaceae bacterium]
MTLTLLIGGARSGKSALAVRRALAYSDVVFLATGEARDEEMAERIDRHRDERPAGWHTVEEPLRLAEAIGEVAVDACLIVDCLSLWVANLIEHPAAEIEREAIAAAELAAHRSGPTIAVTNEVGLGIVPVTPLGRAYRDALGRVNAIWASAAAEALFVVAGRTLRLERPDA